MGDSNCESRDIYECIFYAKKLGLNFKFQNNKAYVVSYDEEEFTANSGLAVDMVKPVSSSGTSYYDVNIKPGLQNKENNNSNLDNSNKVSDSLYISNPSVSSVNHSASMPRATVVIPGLSTPTPKPTAVVVAVSAEPVLDDPFSSSSPVVVCNSGSVATNLAVSPTPSSKPILEVQAEPMQAVAVVRNMDSKVNDAKFAEEVSPGELVKVILECSEIFGKDNKKICKLSLSKHLSSSSSSSSDSTKVEQLIATLRSKYPTLPTNRPATLKYFDQDVSEYVDLDEHSWDEMVAQPKVLITIAFGDIIVPVEEPVSVNIDIPITVLNQELDNASGLATELNAVNLEVDCSTSANQASEVQQPTVTTSITDSSPGATASTHNTQLSTDSTITEPSTVLRSNPVKRAEDECSKPILGSYLYSINSVKVLGLEKELVVALLRQQQRPMIMEFIYEDNADTNGFAALNSTGSGDSKSKTGVKRANGKSGCSIPYDMFIAKYNHTTAASMVKEIEKWLVDYEQADWHGPYQNGQDLMIPATFADGRKPSKSTASTVQSTVTPSQTIVSYYRHIQSKLVKLGLFDNSKAQGGGMPEMGEEQWDDVCDHIETYICSKIAKFTLSSLALKYRFSGIPADDAVMKIGNSTNARDLHSKLARLKFITLEQMGLYRANSPNYKKNNEAKIFNSNFVVANESIREYNLQLAMLPDQEEWRLAMKEIHRATEFESPYAIMKRFVTASKIIAHAAEAYLSSSGDSNGTPITKQSSVGFRKLKPSEDAGFAKSLSADELLPAMAWVVIQANPRGIDNILWFCEEFRHPDRMHGETAYALAQLSSAVEFCRNITGPDALDMYPDDFPKYIQSYELTQQLIAACKRGNVAFIKSCVNALNDSNAKIGSVRNACADVNGLDSNQVDRPLSTCVRYQQLEAAKLLLACDRTKVNARLSPCSGGAEGGYTSLHLAAISGHQEMVLLLLQYGADRNLLDDSGHTPLNIAASAEHKNIVNILLADPLSTSLIDNIIGNNLLLVEGLLKQNVDVCGCNSDNSQFPLLAAVKTGNTKILNLMIGSIPTEKSIITSAFAAVNINQVNANGETALMYVPFVESIEANTTTKSGKYTLDYEAVLVNIAALLLSSGADREMVNADGMRAVDYCRIELGRLQNIQSGGLNDDVTIGPGVFDQMKIRVVAANDIDAYCRGLQRVIHMLSYNPKHYQMCEMSRLKKLDAVQALIDQGSDPNTPDPSKGYTPLIAAVFNEDCDMIRLLLTVGCVTVSDNKVPKNKNSCVGQLSILNINKEGRNGMKALHYAAQCGNCIIVGLLLQFGADRTLLNDQGHTALHVATVNGRIDAGNVLRYDPAVVPICLAVKHGDWIVAKSLLLQGVSINAKQTHYEKGSNNTIVKHDLASVLITAVAYRQTELFFKLLDSDEIPSFMRSTIQYDLTNNLGETALMYACQLSEESMALTLLNRGADRYLVDNGGRTALSIAKQQPNTSIVSMLEFDPKKVWLHDVIRNNNFAGVVALLKQKVNVNVRRFLDAKVPNSESQDSEKQRKGRNTAQPTSPVENSRASTNVTAKGKSGAAFPVTDGEIPFTVAAACNCIEIINLLVKCPELDINRVDGLGRSALFHACMNGQEETVLLLLKQKANRKTIDYQKKSACDIAISSGYLQVAALLQADPYVIHIHDMCTEGKVLLVNALLLQGCPVNYKDERSGMNSQTPLLAACAAGKVEVVKLLSKKPNILLDEKDSLGRTPLMRAARFGALNITAILLAGGCDRNATDNEGKTAKDYAYAHSIKNRMSYMSQLVMF